MGRFVFLDIDGVLNNHDFNPEVMSGQIHADKVARLNRILRATDAKVVLSSAWRYIVYRGESTLTGMEWLFRSHGMLADRLIGITGRDSTTRGVYTGEQESWPVFNERGQQISDWIVGEGWKHYGEDGCHVVIDDLDLGISAAGHCFVQTDGSIGLTDADVDKAIQLLTKGGEAGGKRKQTGLTLGTEEQHG